MEVSSENSISKDHIESFSQSYNSKKYSRAMTNAIAKKGIKAVSCNNDVLKKMKHTFSLELDTMKVTNQKKSGRCWMFAGLNLLREQIGSSLEMDYFELSQNYIAFWDKLEKINFYLKSIMDNIDESVDSRIMTWLLDNVISDGGQWDMFVNLIDKYGIVPKDVMSETFHSSQTNEMNTLIYSKLREYTCKIRDLSSAGSTIDKLREYKFRMLDEMYALLCMFFGEPPKTFDFEYFNKEKKFYRDKYLSPADFAKKIYYYRST